MEKVMMVGMVGMVELALSANEKVPKRKGESS